VCLQKLYICQNLDSFACQEGGGAGAKVWTLGLVDLVIESCYAKALLYQWEKKPRKTIKEMDGQCE